MGELVTLMRHLDPRETGPAPRGRGRGHGRAGRNWASRPATPSRLTARPRHPIEQRCVTKAATRPRGKESASWTTWHENQPTFRSSCWNRIDDTVIGTARKQLDLPPLPRGVSARWAPGATTVAVDGVAKEEVLEDGIGRIVGRTRLELPLLYEDFTLLGRDLELAAQTGLPVEPVRRHRRRQARPRAARTTCVLNGNKAARRRRPAHREGFGEGEEGRLEQPAENGFADVAAAVSQLAKTGYLGRYALAVAPDLYLDLQRLQPSTGLLEIDRIQKLIGDNVYMTQRPRPRQGRARVRRARVRGPGRGPGPLRRATWSSPTSTTRSASWRRPPCA